jgi:TusA-related sulfurtransferase
MEVTPKTNINALLETYPQLERFLMDLNPKYKKLKNPVLRRTVARIATLTQVAMIGGYKPLELVNLIRKELGQPPLGDEGAEETPETEEKRPEWVPNEATVILDGSALLEAEKNPLAEVRKAMKNLEPGQTLRLDTDFLPAPLIDTFREDGILIWAEKLGENEYRTWLLKKQ